MDQTPRTARILETAERRASDLGHDHIGTEHLLIAMLEEHGGVVTAALEEFVDLETLRSRVLAIVQSDAYKTSSPLPGME